jgi:hypothetical protein
MPLFPDNFWGELRRSYDESSESQNPPPDVPPPFFCKCSNLIQDFICYFDAANVQEFVLRQAAQRDEN